MSKCFSTISIQNHCESLVFGMLSIDDKMMLFHENNTFFFVGIGGISMSALALIMKEKGFKIKGYDRCEDSETIDTLRQNGIFVCHHFTENLFDGVTHVVYTAAIRDDDVMLTYPRSCGIPTMERSVFLGLLMKQEENPIGIAGTHGKSSTSGMIASVFMEADKDPTILVGAKLPALDSCYRIGKGNDFIFEACEYKDSFLDFFPKVAVILNIALDHVDYFADLDAIIRSFSAYIAKAKTAVLNLDCENTRKAAENYRGISFWYSANGNENADYYAKNISLSCGHAVFDAYFRGTFLGTVKLGVTGFFQISNALAAIATAHINHIDFSAIQKGLSVFTGVNRRFEQRGFWNKTVPLIEDYAHHPDEIRATVSAALSLSPKHLVAVFQPHTYSRTAGLFDEFTKAFDGCSRIIFTDIYAAREKPNGVTSKMLADATQNGIYCPDAEAVCRQLDQILSDGDVLLVMGAGTIHDMIPTLLKEKN